jgi:hypothetical protein
MQHAVANPGEQLVELPVHEAAWDPRVRNEAESTRVFGL